MKHLKKLSVVLMMTTLFSVSFTSCIDNEVSPLVEAIYEAQADLIAAQAGVQNAEAALLLAQAQSEEANAALLEAQAEEQIALNAGITANNAYLATQRVQYLLELVAETNLNVANFQNDLAEAQIQFDIDMAELIAEMEAAGAQLAATYAEKYSDAMGDANDILSDKLDAEADLAAAMLMQTTVGFSNVSWTYALAQLEGAVAVQTANVSDLEIEIAAMEAYIANPTTPEAMVSALMAENEDLIAQKDAKSIEIANIEAEITALINQGGLRNELVDQFVAAESDLLAAQAIKEAQQEIIDDALIAIGEWELVLADYPAALAGAQTAIDDATTAIDDATTAIETAEGDLGVEIMPAGVVGDDSIAPAVTLYEVLWNADLALAEELAAQAIIVADVAALYANYQAAIDLYATLDAGEATLQATIDAETLTLDALVIAQGDAEDYYGDKVTAFELSPSGSTWFDLTTPLGTTSGVVEAYTNTKIGIHTDDDLYTSSYSMVSGWVEVGAGTGNYVPTGLAAPMLVAIPVGGTLYTGTVAQGLGNPAPATAYYVEVEADDVSELNTDLLNDAVALLDTANEAVYAQEIIVADAEEALTVYQTTTVADAEANYIHLKDLYENEVLRLADAQTAVDVATNAQDDAQTAVDDAINAIGVDEGTPDLLLDDAFDNDPNTLYQVLFNAQLSLLIAEDDLATLESSNPQDEIDTLNAAIDTAQGIINVTDPIIDAFQVIVDSLQADYDAYIAAMSYVDISPNNSWSADLDAQIIALLQAKWLLEQEWTILDNAYDLNVTLISAYGSYDLEDLADDLAALETQLSVANGLLELAEQALASAQVEKMADIAYISYLEALIDTLEQDYANALAIAAKYKALMDAALAS